MTTVAFRMKRVSTQLCHCLVPNGVVHYGRNGNDDPFFFRPGFPTRFPNLLVGVLGKSPGWRYGLRLAVYEFALVDGVLEDPIDGRGLPLVSSSGCGYTLIR